MLDLQAGVHFKEVEVAFRIHEELDRAGTHVAAGAGGLHGGPTHGVTQFRCHEGGGGFFDDLLMAALDGAVAFVEMDDVAMPVGKDLDFDMPGGDDRLFQNERVGAEGVAGFGARGPQCGQKILFPVHAAHAATAAACRSLDHDRKADLARGVQQHAVVPVITFVTGHAGNVRPEHGQLGFALGSHQANGLHGGADEGEAGLLTAFGKVGILGQETIAGMDGIGAGALCRPENGIRVQIGSGYCSRTQTDRFVSQTDMAGMAVGLAVDGNRAVAQIVRRAQDATGDFPPVGDQNLMHPSPPPSGACVSA